MKHGHAEGQIVKLLSDMIRIPSVCPENRPSDTAPGEQCMAEFVARHLGDLGFEIEIREVLEGRPNLTASYGPAVAARTVAFEFHLDTVGVEGMSTPAFDPIVKDGRVYGRGACDDKGPAAALLCALSPEVLAAAKARGVRIVVIGAMGEERGNIGAENLVRNGFRADQIVVLEPTELAIIHAHKGALWFEAEIRGRSAHGSTPEKGLNAICAGMSVIDYLLESTATAVAQNEDPLLGKPTINIGAIRGGTHINIVPDMCVIEVDRRILPQENAQAIVDELQAELNRMKADGEIVDGGVRVRKHGKAFHTAPNSELVERLSEACRTCGVEPRLEGAPWYSDAGELSQVCREIAVFGPGSIHQAHTAEEYIDIRELKLGADILKEFILRM